MPRKSVNSRIWSVIIFMIIALVAASRLYSLSAQDIVPSETPTETATLASTETPTPLPSETAIAPFTETQTEIPTTTFTETSNPTATIIEISSATATNTIFTPSPLPTFLATSTLPAFAPEPTLEELFSDNFDSGLLYLWTLGMGWGLVPSEGGQALQVSNNSNEPVTFVHNNLTNVAVQARFLFDSNKARLSIRHSDAGSYAAELNATGLVELYRGTQLIGVAVVNANVPGQWRTVRVSAIGDIIRVTIDGVEAIAVQDGASLPAGTLSIAGIELEQNTLTVDDVQVWIPSNELSTPTSVPTEVAAISQSALALQSVTGRDIAYMDGVNFTTSSVQVLDGNGNSLFTATGGFPEWSITGTQLAYLSPVPQVNRHNFNTGVTEALGNTTTLILPRINGTFWDPVWSPSTSNNKVAFVWSRSTDRVDIYVMNVDGTDVRNLTSGVSDPINFLPVWSPDGQWIAFTSTDNSATTYKVRIIRANGTGSIIEVPMSPASATLPFWAGDGSQLAFWGFTTDPTNPSFAMVSFDSSAGTIGTVATLNPTASADWGRVWMPGGGQYAYMANFNATTKTFELLYSGDGSLIGTGWFPKWRPTDTQWLITVSPDALIPPIDTETEYDCPAKIRDHETEGVACALRTYAEYGALTWADLIALILHAEGDAVLSSSTNCTDNTFPGKPAPIFPPPTPTPPPTPIPVPVNFVTSPCSPVQDEYIYAIAEQMFNKCDQPTNVPDNVGQCSEEGLRLFLGQVQRYRENLISDATTYFNRARQEIIYFTDGQPESPDRVFGRCPCTTGNVATIPLAEQGQERPAGDPGYASYQDTNYPGYWYSYSIFDNGTSAGGNRYLKIY